MYKRPTVHSDNVAIEDKIGSSYEDVKIVADNIDAIITAAAGLEASLKYLGAYSAAPTLRPDGTPLQDGDYYFDTTDGVEGIVYYDLNDTLWFKVDPQLAIDAATRAETAATSAEASELVATTKADEASTSATNAAASEAIAVQAGLDAIAARDAASISEINAAASALAASASATSASTSESNASTSEANAALSATNAGNSEASVASDALTATNAASSATASKDAAALSESNASTSETNAETSNVEAEAWADSETSPVFVGAPVGSKSAKVLAEEAVTSATNASNSESSASTSASSASASATAAQTAEINADAAATIATTKASEANSSASSAATSESNASTSESNAASSEANATTAASTATTKASEANASAIAAATSETNAGVSETNASNSEISAGLSESAAALSETNAGISEVNADDAANIAAANANYKGEWSGLTGALNIPASVKDGGAVYMLNTNLADVTLSQPSANPSDWFLLGVIGDTAPDSDRLGGELPAFYQEKLVSGSNIKTVNGEDVLGSGNVEIAIGSGGYAANVYLTDLTSATVGTYNQISYTPDALQIVVSTVCNNNEVLAEEYIFDGDIQSDSIPAGEWSFHFHRYVSEIQADSYIRFEFFLREAGGTENVIFSVSSKSINDTVEDAENISFTKDAIPTNQTDRAGVKVYVSTTRNQNTTVSYIVGDGTAAYFTAPIAIRHSQMRARDAADSHPISAITNLQTELDGKEPTFTKNTGFNKDIGTSAGTVAAGDHVHTKADVGLINVDNTSDANKPISIAQQSALDGKVDDGQVLTNVPAGAVFTDTTYSVGDGGLTEKNFTTADNIKLDNIASNANNYSHPVNHPPSIITQDSSNRFVTDAEKTSWNNKSDTDTVYDDTAIQAEVDANTAKVGITPIQASDITANNAKVSNVTTDLTFSRDATTLTVESSDGTDAVLPAASVTEAGLMSAADKVALDAAGTGGGSIIGDLQPLHVNTTNGLHINAAGEHWLETGNVSTDIVTYPDAKQGATSGGVYASNSFGQATTSASGLTFDGTFFWESHTNINRLYKFNSAGVYQGSYMTVAVSNIVSVCMGVGSALHAMASNGQVYEYVAGNNTLIDQFDAGATVPAPQGITWDGTYFWVVSNSTDTVYRLNADGTDSGFSFSISSQSLTPSGIHWNGSYLIVTDSSRSIAYLYEPSGTYSGIFFDVSSEDATPMDITGDGTHLWVVGLATITNYAYTDYSPYVGILTAETDTSTSLPIFVRIK